LQCHRSLTPSESFLLVYVLIVFKGISSLTIVEILANGLTSFIADVVLIQDQLPNSPILSQPLEDSFTATILDLTVSQVQVQQQTAIISNEIPENGTIFDVKEVVRQGQSLGIGQ